MQEKSNTLIMGILVQMIDSTRVKGRRTSDDSVYFITLPINRTMDLYLGK